ncbi:hypothetical protein M0R36_07965 [bacterium]|jgi:ABC-type transport system involved in multi-copper enzyme maturation permease subunit|nr:hypothetical protein [bacterium]
MNSVIVTIAKNTFVEAFRKRIFQVIFIFSILIILSTQFFTFFTFGEEVKILKDIGMAGITFFSLIISLVIGSSCIQTDMEKKTIYTVLSYPVSRKEYIYGRAAGVFCYIIFAVFILSMVFYTALSVKTYFIGQKFGEDARFNFVTFSHNIELLKGVWLIIVKCFIIISIALLSSMFFQQTFTIIVCFLAYILGHLTGFIANMAASTGKIFGYLMTGFYYIFPNLEFFNVSDYISVGKHISASYILLVTIYGIIYSLMLVLITAKVFEKKDM